MIATERAVIVEKRAVIVTTRVATATERARKVAFAAPFGVRAADRNVPCGWRVQEGLD